MIICSSNNIDFIQGSVAYANEPLITDWRIENSNGVLNVLNSKSTNVNLAVLEGGNISIGTTNQSGSLAIYGNINITGNYNKNSRDVINDTSNYILSTSNILVSCIRTEVNYTSNYVSSISLGSGGGSSQWTSGTSLIFYNGGNVGIGTATPSSKLHIYNDNNNTSNLGLLIQNNLSISATPNITIVGTTLTTIGVDKIITFPYSGSGATMSYSFTTTEVLQCDILIIGGGGGGGYSYAGGGGGGGGYVYVQNINFPIGTYNVNVGRGGAAGVNGAAPAGWGINGNNSSITGGFNYTALGGGGGAGGSAFNYPTPITGIGSNGGSGGGGAFPATGGLPAGGTSTQVSTYGYGNGGNGNNYTSQIGGGGGGASGIIKGSGTGNDGLANSITGSSITYAGGGGGGTDFTTIYQGGSGGGGAGANGSGSAPSQGTDGLGGGGGGARGSGAGPAGRGGNGIVIIRYRKMNISSSINFMIGTSINTIRNYNIGNYNGEYKINTSKQGTSDATFFRIADDGTMYNAQGTTNFTSASDKRVKENIERASYNKCYENINRLKLYRFNYINNFNTINNDNKQLGFIAQEVREYFPKAVYSNNYNNNNINIGDLLSIDVSQINYTLYGAVKKLIEFNDYQTTRIQKLEQQIYINTIDTSNITIDTSNITQITSNIALDTSNITIDTSNITLDNTEQYINRYWQYINQYTSNIAIDTSNLPIDTSNTLSTTSNIAIDTSNTLPTTSNIALDTSNIALDTSNISIDTSNIALDIL